MSAKIKVILSDLDGVIRHFPSAREAQIEKRFGIPTGLIAKIAFSKDLLDNAITGRCTDAVWRNMAYQRLACTVDLDLAKQALGQWSDYPGQINVDVFNFILSHKPTCEVALLTNATTRLNLDLEKLEIFNAFDRIFNSSEIGFAKPDPMIFKHVLKVCGHRSDEIFFIDDSIVNVRAAEKFGFRVHHFSSLSSLDNALKQEM